ncbi:MAG: DNA translocase FtsK 4TM domain-containing protein [Candidatus Latescibacteria bacterium]|nr:DNA translocase FtsK 4TM domain-containing protein [Candidatus Latescibacterota bacterium]
MAAGLKSVAVDPMPELAERRLPENRGPIVLGVLVSALGVFLLLSLLTHSKFDPPNSSRMSETTINWAGQIGAYYSYAAFTAIGTSAFVLPTICFLWGWNRLRRYDPRGAAGRTLGLLGLALFLSIAAGLPTYSPYLAFELGGSVGTWTASTLLIPYAGRVGSTIVLLALLIASLLQVTDLDPRRIGQFVVRGFMAASGSVSGVLAAIGRIRLPELRRRPTEIDEDVEEEDEEEVDEREWHHDMEETPSGLARLPTISRDELMEAVSAEEDIAHDEDPISKQEDQDPLTPPQSQSIEKKAAAIPEKVKGAPTKPLNGKKDDSKAHRSASAEAPSKKRKPSRYKLPKVALLDPIPDDQGEVDREILLQNAKVLEDALHNFDVSGKVVEVSPGPVVTRYEVEPASGVKVGRISALADDLARVMSAQGIRIQAPVPGKKVVGVEIANHNRETVYLREIVESQVFKKADPILTMALGKTISGDTYVADLAKMPHLLVAGATGAGKSVCINCLICSILLRATPDQVRLLMVDPKVVELTMYNDIPHLLVPVITEPKKASEALKWAVAEMEVRYQMLARMAVRNLADYNARVEKITKQREAGEEVEIVAEGEEIRTLPHIVIIIDEFADLMLTAPADVETSLMGLAQKSRAVGIHIILATQRPSVNVITGVIKANFPSRIAFQVASKTDSRTILDMNGAERLLGRGDMLFLPGGQGEPVRVHGAFISGEETERLVEAIKETGHEAEKIEVFSERGETGDVEADRDELFDEAVNVVLETRQASTSFLQRRMKVGYSRAARLMDELEFAGVVGPAEGAKPREILVETPVEEEELV